MTIVFIAACLEATMIALAVRANRRFGREERLPMQWSISWSKPLSETVNRSAPRVIALSFAPLLSTGILMFFVLLAMTQSPRPGQEHMVMPALLVTGGILVAVQVLHLWLIAKTLEGRTP